MRSKTISPSNGPHLDTTSGVYSTCGGMSRCWRLGDQLDKDFKLCEFTIKHVENIMCVLYMYCG